MEILAIIPARGGSKGIPRKNIVNLGGKPLLTYTIEAALTCKSINRTVVSTESSCIAKVSLAAGAEVAERSAKLATDECPTEPVLIDVLKRLEKDDYHPDLVILLQPTSPLRGPNVIDECVQKLVEKKADSVLTVCENYHFYWRRESNKLKALYDYKNRPRRQDMKAGYQENGAVYVTRTPLLIMNNNRLSGKIEIVIMSELESIEIDTPFDFWLAEKAMEYKRRNNGNYYD